MTVLHDPAMPLVRRRSFQIALAALVVLAVGAAMFVYEQFYREEPAAQFESEEDHFLFASAGTEGDAGVPYWIWLVLPRIFPDLLPAPGGYAALGVISKPGYEMPIGLSKVTIGYPRVGVNCAMCHAGSIRVSPESVPTIVPGAPSQMIAAQQYLRFLTDAAADPRFTAGAILGEISKNTRLSPVERLLYRVSIIPGTRRALLRLREETTWMHARAPWGPGRADRFNPIKVGLLEQPVGDTIGTADVMPLWNLGARPGSYGYYWDGMNTSLREVVMASAVAGGAAAPWMDRDARRWDRTEPGETSHLRRVTDYISSLQPPRFPFAVDQPLAAAGSAVFRTECASCHVPGQPRFGQIVPASEVGTDRHRLETWTTDAAAALNDHGAGRDWALSGFRSTQGYVALSLDGLWARGPYLHNGSVPSVADLLEPVERRPRQFWRGYDVVDPMKVGFVSEGAEAERDGTRYDTSRQGNSNAGHAYGTTLAPALKRALLEYLKTL
jgi:mono/diheme cytochrome c family protein